MVMYVIRQMLTVFIVCISFSAILSCVCVCVRVCACVWVCVCARCFNFLRFFPSSIPLPGLHNAILVNQLQKLGHELC